MISVIITAFKEPRTIAKAVASVLDQSIKDLEVLVVAPDDETLHAARASTRDKRLKIFKDEGKGKSAALNYIVRKAKGKILILTDGDVHIGEEAVLSLFRHFVDKNVGAVTGRPISIDSRKNKYGFWAYLLTEIAHERRQRARQLRKRLFCSGYLFAIRASLFPHLAENLLSEDGFISHVVYQKNYSILYEPSAEVYVKYPSNFPDWIKQKKRSAGGYNQIRSITGADIRSFSSESLGAFSLLKYVKNIYEMWWLFSLFIARVYLWTRIYWDITLKKESHTQTWQRVESTK